MAIRFFLGIAESSTFAGTHYILGSWYTGRELGKRSGIFTASGLAGTMFGGFLQTGINSGLHGTHGLAGWRWLFIIDGVITMPIALYGFLLFPDTPASTTACYLTTAERALAISRVPEVPERRPFNLAFVKRVFTSWYWYGFVMLWIIAGETESFSTNSLLALYMKSTNKYTIPQLNNYPTGVPAVGIISTLFWATLTDFLGGKRYLVGYFIGITGIATAVMILTTDKTSVIFAAYYWAGSVYACQATFFAWANDAMRFEEDSLRAVVIASMNCASNAVNAWWSLLFYSANFAPNFTVSIPVSRGCECREAIADVWLAAGYVGHDWRLRRDGDLDQWAAVHDDASGQEARPGAGDALHAGEGVRGGQVSGCGRSVLTRTIDLCYALHPSRWFAQALRNTSIRVMKPVRLRGPGI